MMQYEHTPTSRDAIVGPEEEHEATKVSGKPTASTEQMLKGDLFASRYEIIERIHEDAIVRSYQAIDVQTGQNVLLHILSTKLLPDVKVRTEVVTKIREHDAKSIQKRLIDVAYEGSRVYTVESLPKGIPMRRTMRRRASKAKRYTQKELASILRPLSEELISEQGRVMHGHIRAEYIWVDGDEVSLRGWYLTAFLPEKRFKRFLTENAALRLAFAPEFADTGKPSDKSDCYGLAAVAYEALTGRQPDPDLVISNLGKTGDALSHCLKRDPKKRNSNGRAILEALQEDISLKRRDDLTDPNTKEIEIPDTRIIKNTGLLYSETPTLQQAQQEQEKIELEDAEIAVALGRRSRPASKRTWLLTLLIASGLAVLILGLAVAIVTKLR